MGTLFLALIFGIFLLLGPLVAKIAGHDIGAMPTLICMGFGAVIGLVCSSLLIVTKLYVRTKASEAFVRTGWGGMLVVKDGGALVIPVVHEIVRISLQTLRMEVERKGTDALLTEDKLRADVKAEFFVRVQPEDDAIKAAARSFGESGEHNSTSDNKVRGLVEDKLVSALRSVAATKTLESLNAQRDDFVAQVTKIVTPDLAHNGLTLEVATISRLDQTDPKNLNENNVFDAQGLRAITETTQAQLTKRNELMRAGEQARKEQDVATKQRMLELEQTQAEAEAQQKARIAEVSAEQERLAKQKQIEATQAVAVSEVAKVQAIEVAQRVQQQAVAIADGEKRKAETQAQQTVEVAEREREQAVAKAEANRATEEAALARAETDRERAQQEIQTVQVQMTAEREKAQQVTAAEASAEMAYVTAKRGSDANAYGIERAAAARKTSAEAEAAAKKMNAEADAAATLTTAEADAKSKTMQAQASQVAAEAQAAGAKAQALAKAEGMKAEAMVPVEADRQRTEVERQRVVNLAQELEVREKHGAAGQEFELAKLRITVEGEVRKAQAGAMSSFGARVQANVYGTPEDVAAMSSKFMAGMGAMNLLEGANVAMSPQVRETLGNGIAEAGKALKEVANTLAGNRGSKGKPEAIEAKAQ